MEYPDNFKVKDRHSGDIVIVKKLGSQYSFTYQRSGFENFFCNATAEYLISTYYDIIQEEPEMMLPFNFTVKPGNTSYEGYTAFQGTKANYVRVTHTDGHDQDNQYTKERVKEYIKDGAWIVTSVGGPSLPDTERFVKTCKSEPSEEAKEFYKSITERPSNTVLDELTIKINSDGVELATERLNKLAEAAEAVNIALESMQKLLGEIGGVNQNVTVEAVHDYAGFNIDSFQ